MEEEILTVEKCFEIMGLKSDSTDDEIKRQFKKLTLIHHPDKNGGDCKPLNNIVKAYKILMDKEKKRVATDSFAKQYTELIKSDRELLYSFSDEFYKNGKFDVDSFNKHFNSKSDENSEKQKVREKTLQELLKEREMEDYNIQRMHENTRVKKIEPLSQDVDGGRTLDDLLSERKTFDKEIEGVVRHDEPPQFIWGHMKKELIEVEYDDGNCDYAPVDF